MKQLVFIIFLIPLVGSAHFSSGQRSELDSMLSVIDIQNAPDTTKVLMLKNVGELYRQVGEMQKALEYFERATKKCSELGLKQEEASILNSIGLTYVDFGNLDKAEGYYLQALELNQSNHF